MYNILRDIKSKQMRIWLVLRTTDTKRPDGVGTTGRLSTSHDRFLDTFAVLNPLAPNVEPHS